MAMEELTPSQVVHELDKYIVGQQEAKRAVAIAVRNRWRRLHLPPAMAEEVAPKNIIMIGPTGVGKTEIARRLAALVRAPFLKIEASRFTEVGYHGRDVESMVRDLVELSVNMVRSEMTSQVHAAAEAAAEERLLDLVLPPSAWEPAPGPAEIVNRFGSAEAEGETAAEAEGETGDEAVRDRFRRTREKLRRKLRAGELDQREVEITIEEKPVVMQGVIAGPEELGFDLQNMLESMMPPRTRTRRTTVGEARQALAAQEAEKLIDRDTMIGEALDRAQNAGIIFLDEIDKIAGREAGSHGPDVSREGVQRDLLPIVEGTTCSTRYGMVRTDHILFIAAGAFHVTRPSDLIPEMQGRFPIRVELDDLGKDDFIRILTEPKNALIKQYTALLGTEGLDLSFEPDAIEEIAAISAAVNERTQNIGARRLQTVMEKLLEEISFTAPERRGTKVVINGDYVRDRLQEIMKDDDLSRYIL